MPASTAQKVRPTDHQLLDAALARGGGIDMFADGVRESLAETFLAITEAQSVWLVIADGLGHELRVARGVGGAMTVATALQLGAWACTQAEDGVVVTDLASDDRLASFRDESGYQGSASWLALPLRAENGRVLGSINALRDDPFPKGIVERRALKAYRRMASQMLYAAAVLRSQQQSMRELYLLSPLPLYVLDAEGRMVSMSQRFLDLLGYTAEEMIDRNPRDFMDAESRQYFLSERERLWAAGGIQDHPCVFLRKDGVVVEVLMSSRVERNVFGKATRALCAVVDVTHQNQLQRELVQTSRVDPLTGAWNRGWFLERLNVEVKRARRHQRPLSLIMLDVDHFKQINDTWGHGAGDLVLQSLAATARSQLRDHDELGRLGGEEFGILLPETPVAGAMVVAERLRRTLHDQALQYLDESITATISVGVCEVLVTERSEEALARVDAAMYAAKRGGRNRTVVWGKTPVAQTESPSADPQSASSGEKSELGMLF